MWENGHVLLCARFILSPLYCDLEPLDWAVGLSCSCLSTEITWLNFVIGFLNCTKTQKTINGKDTIVLQ